MVLSVPYQARIKLLGRICSPLKDPGPTSPAPQTRGAIVAVEGDDLKAVRDLADWLNDFLAKDEEYTPRLAEPPKSPSYGKREASFEEYLDLIKDWHTRSKEMTRYITTPITSSPVMSSKGSDTETDRKDSATPPDSPRKSASPTITTSTVQSSNTSKKPIIILPTFQLHASVVYASRIPIQDAYSPTDHWQWMATLWRGTVGPDLTIYVKSYDAKEGPGQGKMVELDDSVRCLTILKPLGKPFLDASLRRLGFEVGEWVRGIGARKEV